MAQAIVSREDGVRIGSPISKYFPPAVEDHVRQAIDSGQQINLDGPTLNCNNYKAVLMPLSGPFKGRGVVMTMHP